MLLPVELPASNGSGSGLGYKQFYPERASHIFGSIHPNSSTHHFDQVFCHGEPNTHPLFRACFPALISATVLVWTTSPGQELWRPGAPGSPQWNEGQLERSNLSDV